MASCSDGPRPAETLLRINRSFPQEMTMAAAKALAEISLRTKLPDGNILPPVSALKRGRLPGCESGWIDSDRRRARSRLWRSCARAQARRRPMLNRDVNSSSSAWDRFHRVSIRVVVNHAARAGGGRAASSTCSAASAFMYKIPRPTRTSGHIVPDPHVRNAARMIAAFMTA